MSPFTTLEDNLNHWMVYGGGFALGFRSEALAGLEFAPSILDEENLGEVGDTSLACVKYSEEEAGALIQNHLRAFQPSWDLGGHMFLEYRAVFDALVAVAQLKIMAFQDEREWRVVYVPRDLRFHREFTATPGGLIRPHFNLSFLGGLQGALVSVRLAPNMVEGSARGVKQFLKEHSLDSVDVRESDYRIRL